MREPNRLINSGHDNLGHDNLDHGNLDRGNLGHRNPHHGACAQLERGASADLHGCGLSSTAPFSQQQLRYRERDWGRDWGRDR